MLPFEKITAATNNLLADNPNPTDQDIRALALELATQAYEIEIRKQLASRNTRLAHAQLLAEHGYFIFVEPEKPPITVAEGKDEIVLEKPPRQSYKVKQKDLAAFAKQFGLDENTLREVGLGQRRDHKRWTRGVGMMGQFELGQPYKETKVKPAQPKKPEAKAVRIVRPWSAPTVTWTPED
jgi:hypothetical protein